MTLTDLQADILNSKHLKLADGEEGKPDADTVPQTSHHGVPQHRAGVFEERPRGHEVAGVEDDGWEHVEEEDVGVEDGGGLLFDWVHDGANDEADGNQEAGLWDPDGDFMVNVETWREDNENILIEDLILIQTLFLYAQTQTSTQVIHPNVPILAKEASRTHSVNSKGTWIRG